MNLAYQFESWTPDLEHHPIENAIKDAVEQGRHVYIVGATGKIRQRLERLGILNLIPPHNLTMDRLEALGQAVALVNGLEPTATKHRPDDGTTLGYLTTWITLYCSNS
jgi:hypothetical protein